MQKKTGLDAFQLLLHHLRGRCCKEERPTQGPKAACAEGSGLQMVLDLAVPKLRGWDVKGTLSSLAGRGASSWLQRTQTAGRCSWRSPSCGPVRAAHRRAPRIRDTRIRGTRASSDQGLEVNHRVLKRDSCRDPKQLQSCEGLVHRAQHVEE